MQNMASWKFCIVVILFVWLVITVIYKEIANRYAKRDTPIKFNAIPMEYIYEEGSKKHGFLVCRDIETCEVIQFLDKYRGHQYILENMIGEPHIIYVTFSFVGFLMLGIQYTIHSIK